MVGDAFAQNPSVQVTFACDADSAVAESAAVQLGAAHWTTHYQEVLESAEVDLVYVGVPPGLHSRIALEAIAARKHLLCEKPMALTLAEAQAMTAAAREAGIVHAVNISIGLDPGV